MKTLKLVLLTYLVSCGKHEGSGEAPLAPQIGPADEPCKQGQQQKAQPWPDLQSTGPAGSTVVKDDKEPRVDPYTKYSSRFLVSSEQQFVWAPQASTDPHHHFAFYLDAKCEGANYIVFIKWRFEQTELVGTYGDSLLEGEGTYMVGVDQVNFDGRRWLTLGNDQVEFNGYLQQSPVILFDFQESGRMGIPEIQTRNPSQQILYLDVSWHLPHTWLCADNAATFNFSAAMTPSAALGEKSQTDSYPLSTCSRYASINASTTSLTVVPSKAQYFCRVSYWSLFSDRVRALRRLLFSNFSRAALAAAFVFGVGISTPIRRYVNNYIRKHLIM